MKRRSRFWLIPLALIAAFFIYVSIYYRADETALSAMISDDAVSVERTSYGWRFDGPSEAAGLIFYPGAKVEETAYAPLLKTLAAEGLDVCLVKMPFRLAVFDGGAAGRVMRAHDYDAWFIGGHSLGGAMAASFAAKHPEGLSGLILLAAYPTRPLPDTLVEIALTGSEDRVLNWAKFERGREYAPSRYVESIIEGGNHAQFGSYGAQRGDGVAAISPEEQVYQTVRIIMESLTDWSLYEIQAH